MAWNLTRHHMCIFFIIIIKVPFSKLHKQYHTAMELCTEVQPWKVIHAAIPQNFSDAAVLSKHCYMPIWQLIVQECHNISVIVKSVKSRSENGAFNKWPNLTCSSLFNRHSTVHKTEPNIIANAKKKLFKSFLNRWDNMYNQLHARQLSPPLHTVKPLLVILSSITTLRLKGNAGKQRLNPFYDYL